MFGDMVTFHLLVTENHPRTVVGGPQSKASGAIIVSNTSTQNTFAGLLKLVFGRSWIPIQAETLSILFMFFMVFISHFGQIPGYHLI